MKARLCASAIELLTPHAADNPTIWDFDPATTVTLFDLSVTVWVGGISTGPRETEWAFEHQRNGSGVGTAAGQLLIPTQPLTCSVEMAAYCHCFLVEYCQYIYSVCVLVSNHLTWPHCHSCIPAHIVISQTRVAIIKWKILINNTEYLKCFQYSFSTVYTANECSHCGLKWFSCTNVWSTWMQFIKAFT